MIFQALPFGVYLFLFCFLISRIPFFRNSGIILWVLITLFCIKVGVGIIYGLYFKSALLFYKSDTWRFYRESIPETQLLLHNPYLFVKSLFVSNYNDSGGFLVSNNSFWNDLKDNIIIKLLAICNVFSRNNYFTNTIFFNFLSLFGLVAYYRLVKLYSISHQFLLLSSIFLLPSFLFWGSGIHKDGLMFSSIGLVFFSFQRIIKDNGKTKYWVTLIVCFLFIFFVKNYLALALIPALIGWWLADRNQQRHEFYFIAVYSGCLLVIILLAMMNSHYNALYYIVKKHNDFLSLTGNSAIQVRPLLASTESAIFYLPTAIDIALFRPHPFESTNIAYLLSFGEIAMTITISLIFIGSAKLKRLMPPFFICCLYFAFSILLLDGYIVTFSGAIVRYRSLMMPFLITPMIALIPEKRKRTRERRDKKREKKL